MWQPRADSMTSHIRSLSLVLALLAPLTLAADQQPARTDRSPAPSWTPLRMADGRPSLEGVWENNSATPLERPKELANKPRLTDAELADMERRAKRLFSPD